MESHKQRRCVVSRPKNTDEICLLTGGDILSKKLMYKRVTYEIELLYKKKTKVYTKHLYCKNIYSNKDEGTEIETLSLDDVFDKYNYATVSSGWFYKWLDGVSGLQTGEKFSQFWVDDIIISIHKNNFVSFKIITTYENDISNHSLEYLMKNLSAEEMIEYLKDNGLNACPIMR